MGKTRIKQVKVPSFVGTFYDVFIMTSPAMAPISYVMLSSTAYAVTREYLVIWVPWLTYPIFLTTLVAFYLLAMIMVYTFLYASYFTHRNDQEYKHSNPIRKDIAKTNVRINELEKKIDELTAEIRGKPGGKDIGEGAGKIQDSQDTA